VWANEPLVRNTYRDAFGAAWKVREVVGAHPVHGFSVDNASPNGAEWTFNVSVEQAANALLLVF
jgi:hypothetical protein